MPSTKDLWQKSKGLTNKIKQKKMKNNKFNEIEANTKTSKFIQPKKLWPTSSEWKEMVSHKSDSESQPTKGQNQPKEQSDNTIEITFLKRT